SYRFFEREAHALEFFKSKDMRICIRFSRLHRYRAWRDWIPFIRKPIDSHTVTLFSNNPFAFRRSDGLACVSKTHEVYLTPMEVEQLISFRYQDLPLSLLMRLSTKLVH